MAKEYKKVKVRDIGKLLKEAKKPPKIVKKKEEEEGGRRSPALVCRCHVRTRVQRVGGQARPAR